MGVPTAARIKVKFEIMAGERDGLAMCCRLHVKSVTSVAEVYANVRTKRRPVKYCTYIYLGLGCYNYDAATV